MVLRHPRRAWVLLLRRAAVPWVVGAAGLLWAGCGQVLMRGKPREQHNAAISGERFKALAVLPVGDEKSNLQMAATVRQQVRDAGLTIAEPGGAWGTETDAVADVCAREASSRPDGIVFVMWDELRLYECETRTVAYGVHGGYAGLDEMTKYLLRYLRRTPPP